MKKIILLTLLVLPLTVTAQSRGDRLVGTYGFKVNTIKSDTLTTQIQRQIINQQNKAKVEKAKKLTKEHCSNDSCTFKQVLKAVFLGGKFPWESNEQYRLRKQVESTPAGQPFK